MTLKTLKALFALLLSLAAATEPAMGPTPATGRQMNFIHPGILHTTADLNRMRANVGAGLEPWTTAYNDMSATSLGSAAYVMQGPKTFITRDHSGDQTNLGAIISDGRAAINLALRYYISKNETYAIVSRDILDAWSNTLQIINGTDVQLGASLTGVNLVNAAEILRYTWDGWAKCNITQFSNMIQNLFVPAAYVQGLAVYPFSGNWGTTAEKAIIAYGVFLNNATLYNNAISMYTTGGPDDIAACGKLPFMIPSATGQYVESGRDQGHTQLSLGNMAELSQVALSQGDDSIFSYLSNRLETSYEYTSEYQMTNNTLPYNSSVACCYCPETFGTWTYLSSVDRYQYRPVHEIAYAYFVSLKGGSMPYTKDLLTTVGIETTNPVNAYNDNAEWGSLRFRRTASL